MKHGKKYRESLTKYDPSKQYDLAQACNLVKELKYANFDETVEAHINLRLGKSQTVRDTLVFPHQFKGEKKVLVFCKEDRIKEALDAGATYAGADEYIEKVKGGWLDFDVAVATPDMMKDVGRLGPVLGRRGIMPNPKTGTVTMDVAGAIKELKQGRVEFRNDKTGVIHLAVGKVSMAPEAVAENVRLVMGEIKKKRPSDTKGDFVKSVAVSSTMGPGVKVDFNDRM